MSDANRQNFEAVIGLEVHAQLLTESKLFCGCSTKFGADPNSNTCPVCLGLPGALPVLNRKAVEYAIRAGLATHCQIAESSVFARKNYFYPDLPKGYQISQFELPLALRGHLDVPMKDGESMRIGITRIHMEEDAGKLTHDSLGQSEQESLVDLNRAGTPLIEIVSEPDMREPEQASEYLKRWRQLLLYLGICDGNLEEGSMRCDANVSVRRKGDTKLYTKVEIKNLNSFRFVQNAIEYEIERQIQCNVSGEKILQETRLWDSDRNVTRSMRSKEEAQDYRYFPEPDLIALQVPATWVEKIRVDVPELPIARLQRLQTECGLPFYDANFLTQEPATAAYFDAAIGEFKDPKTRQALCKAVANWMMGDFTKALKDAGSDFASCKLRPPMLVKLVKLVESGGISGKIAKGVFETMFASGDDPEQIVKREGLAQISDSGALKQIVEKVVAAHPNEAAEYRSGKDKLFGFFVGQVMRESRGQANPALVNQLLKDLLAQR